MAVRRTAFRALGVLRSSAFAFVPVRNFGRKRNKKATARYEEEKQAFDHDMEDIQGLMGKDPAFLEFKTAMSESGLNPVEDDIRLPTDTVAFGSESSRVIPQERAYVLQPEPDSSGGSGAASVFTSRESERQIALNQNKKSSRGQRILELLEEHLHSHKCRISVKPDGAKKGFGLHVVGLEIVNVDSSGRGLHVVTWTTPSVNKELQEQLQTSEGPDASNYRMFVTSDNYDREALHDGISKALDDNTGRIRYFVGQKMNLKRIPELRFKVYSEEEHHERFSIHKLIDLM